MRSNDIERWVKAERRFVDHFEYRPNHPKEIDFDIDAHIKLLDRCISEDFDYTIELYGTQPIKIRGRQPDEPIID